MVLEYKEFIKILLTGEAYNSLGLLFVSYINKIKGLTYTLRTKISHNIFPMSNY